MSKIYATKNPDISVRERENMERVRCLASQGMVLLENRNVLPLNTEIKKIALFGSGARRTVKGGTGSGDVNSRSVINVEQGLEEAGYMITTKSWLDSYDHKVKNARGAYYQEIREALAIEGEQAVMRLLTDPFREPAEPEITEADLRQTEGDIAIYVLARNSGEGKDRKPEAGEYELFPVEMDALEKLAKHYHKVVVVLNVGSIIDTKFLRALPGNIAILLMGQAGCMGGHALVDVLTGKVTPSGKLTDTWAEHYTDYPGADVFSFMNGNLDDEYYKEGIYVGYRYFDTFNISPAYPFGYGLSYTQFSTTVKNVHIKNGELILTVLVKNAGNKYSGKEVIQVYYSAPKGKLEKPYQELAAFAKTMCLAPGEEQSLEISFNLSQMASYDESTASNILEAGDYYIRVGSHSRNTRIVAVLVLENEVVTEKLPNRLKTDCDLDLISAKGTEPFSYEGETVEKEKALRLAIDPEELYCNKASTLACGQKERTNGDLPNDKTLTADDVRDGYATVKELADQLSVEELAELCVGSARGEWGASSVIGAASTVCPGAAGDTTSSLVESRNIRNMILADGPAGLRLCPKFKVDQSGTPVSGTAGEALPGLSEVLGDMGLQTPIPDDAIDYYQYCTAIPIATLLAQTWDSVVIKEAGDIVGGEMEELGVNLWLAPGMNIHRNPLCGRNFEYYSEDPLVTGLSAAWMTEGVQEHPGVGTTIKHFAFNNQEDNRMHNNAHVCERAAREIYLKGFEIAVRKAQPMSMMTSYNLVNGIHAANNVDLLTKVARDEWGFAGIIMTDWGTTGGVEAPADWKYGNSSAAGCIKAGNDLIMPGRQEDVDDIVKAVGAEKGTVPYALTREELQSCAMRMLQIILSSSAYENSKPYGKR